MTDCPFPVPSPCNVFHPSVFAFWYVPNNVCRTTPFLDLVCTLFICKGDSYHDSLHLPLGCEFVTDSSFIYGTWS